MQTFLPYPSFRESAKCLDMKRLGKQRVETKQILLALTQPDYGWKNHPATKMWKGYELALADYGAAMCLEWIARGYKDSTVLFFLDFIPKKGMFIPMYPDWLGNEQFHLSHKSNLLRKMPEHYGHMWPDVPNDIPYMWPV